MDHGSVSHPHSCEDDGEVLRGVVHDVFGLLYQAGLPTDLGGNLGGSRDKVSVRVSRLCAK